MSDLGWQPREVWKQPGRLPAEGRLGTSENTSKPRRCLFMLPAWPSMHMCRLFGVRSLVFWSWSSITEIQYAQGPNAETSFILYMIISVTKFSFFVSEISTEICRCIFTESWLWQEIHNPNRTFSFRKTSNARNDGFIAVFFGRSVF
jgi:hypothetical protein